MRLGSTGTAPRRVGELLDRYAQVEPVIALHGPRSVGKSTILREFARRHTVAVIDLDDLEVRDAVAANLALALGESPPVCVDEYQHVPEVLDGLKARLNREGARPGTAVITGSTRQDAVPRTAQALTGRLHSMTIWPLSQGEIAGVTENVVPALRDDPEAAVAAFPTSATSRAEYAELVCAGGFPMALRRPDGRARSRWFDDYIMLSVERDASELARVRQRQALRDLLDRLGSRTAQVLNLSDAGRGLNLSRTAVEDYTRLLEDLFLVERLPAWGKTLRARAVASPKAHIVDSGVAARLLRVSPAKYASLDASTQTQFGNLLETFVVGELRKQVSWLDEPVTVGHWRTHDGDEVDYVVEFDDGRVLGFEVNANQRISGDDFRGLRSLRAILGDRFVAGVALSTGTRSYSYDDRLHVMPVDRLWQHVG